MSFAQGLLTTHTEKFGWNMEIVHTETNHGKNAIIDSFVYRQVSKLKNGYVVYVCSVTCGQEM